MFAKMRNIKKRTKIFNTFIVEWLQKKGKNKSFETYPKEELTETLHQFYPSARQKPKPGQEEGNRYSKQSLINIRSALNRNLQLPLQNFTWDLMHDT